MTDPKLKTCHLRLVPEPGRAAACPAPEKSLAAAAAKNPFVAAMSAYADAIDDQIRLILRY